MNKYIPEKIGALEEYRPDTSYRKIRLDANESPFLMSGKMKEAAEKAAAELLSNRYPDPYAKKLISAFSKAYGIEYDNVVAGNGSDELISLIFTAFVNPGDKIVVTSPDFSMYAFYAELCGTEIIKYRKNDANEIDFAELEEVIKRENTKLVIFSNPCNPTGRSYSAETVARFFSSVNCIVVADEAYGEFSERNISVMDMAAENENLIVLKTLSKAFGMASLRVGFAVTNSEMASALRKVKSPYNLSTFSQEMGSIALSYADEIFAAAKDIGRRARLLKNDLEKLFGDSAEVFDTDANFVFIDVRNEERARNIQLSLADESIAIRRMNGRFLRITCGSNEENICLLETLAKII